jgi:hypothetical protein
VSLINVPFPPYITPDKIVAVFFDLFTCHHHAPRQWDIQTWVEKKGELVERPPTGIKNRERECCKQTRANSMPDRSVIWVLTPPDRQTDHWTDESLHTEFHSICKSQDLVLLWKFNQLRLVLRYVNDLASLFSNYPTTPLISEWRMIVPFSWSEGLGGGSSQCSSGQFCDIAKLAMIHRKIHLATS